MRIAGLDSARHDGELQVVIRRDRAVVGDPLRIALRHQEGLADAVGRLGELNLLAALRIDEHARGDDVEAAGLQARNQRSELGQHAVDLRDAHLGEHRPHDFWRFAGELAVRRGKAVGRFVGEADTNVTMLLGAFEGRLRLGRERGGKGGDAGGQSPEASAGTGWNERSSSVFLRSTA